jgi:hypothetical protein
VLIVHHKVESKGHKMKKYMLMSVALSICLAGAVYAADNLADHPPIEEGHCGQHHGKPNPEGHFKRLEADIALAQSTGKISAQDAQDVRAKIAALQAAHVKMEAEKAVLQVKLDALGLKPMRGEPRDMTRHLEHLSQDIDLAEKGGKLSAIDAKSLRQQILSIRTQIQQTEAAGNHATQDKNIQGQMEALHRQLKQLKVMPARPPRALF